MAGKSPSAARQALTSAGLKAAVVAAPECGDAQFADRFCLVAKQSLQPGTRTHDDTVTLTVEPKQMEVPQVVGLKPTDAETAMDAAGLTLNWGSREPCRDEQFADRFCVVESQDPAAGTSINAGQYVGVVFAPMPVKSPSLVGMSAADADAALTAAGLTAKGIDTAPKPPDGSTWKVTAQDPTPGTPMTAGDQVTVTLDLPMVTMPDVSALSAADAVTAIEKAGLTTSFASNQGEPPATGSVIAQSSVAQGASVQYGTNVDLTWGFKIPNVVGQTLSAATDTLKPTDAKIVVSGRTDSDEKVTAQNPAAGTAVAPGATVTLTTRPEATVSQSNAEERARSYLKSLDFSRSGLIDQLEYEGYSTADATYAVDEVNPDWNAEAAESAKSYLSHSAFSRSRLIDQLEYEGFTYEQAVYGVNAAGL